MPAGTDSAIKYHHSWIGENLVRLTDTYGTKLHFLRRFSYKINYSIWLNDLHFDDVFMHSEAKVSKVFRVNSCLKIKTSLKFHNKEE